MATATTTTTATATTTARATGKAEAEAKAKAKAKAKGKDEDYGQSLTPGISISTSTSHGSKASPRTGEQTAKPFSQASLTILGLGKLAYINRTIVQTDTIKPYIRHLLSVRLLSYGIPCHALRS